MNVQERNVQTGCTWLTCSSNTKKINAFTNKSYLYPIMNFIKYNLNTPCNLLPQWFSTGGL